MLHRFIITFIEKIVLIYNQPHTISLYLPRNIIKTTLSSEMLHHFLQSENLTTFQNEFSYSKVQAVKTLFA